MPYLTKHESTDGPRWALDGRWLADDFTLARLLQLPASGMPGFLQAMAGTETAAGPLVAPIDKAGEVWAAGVTYLRSREAREAESSVRDVYSKVYDAAHPRSN